jgi:iron complex outermembrane receptor protein
VIPASRRRSALGNGEFHFTDDLKIFGEFLYTDQYDAQLAGPATFAGAVSATNPTNPFHVPVTVFRLLTEAGPVALNVDSKLYRGVVGLDGKVGSWDWEAYVLDSSESNQSTNLNQVNTAAFTKALASNDPNVAPNLFTSAPIPASILNPLLNPPTTNNNNSDNLQASFYLRGSVWDLPAGPLSMVFGAEPRVERVHFEAHATSTSFTQQRTIVAEFAELRVPLFSDSMDIPLLDRLTLTAAGRNDHYSDFGSSFNPQFGAEWSPVKLLNLRTSYGHSFRAPTLFEMYEPPISTTGVVVDPTRKNAPSPVALVSGGNRNLEPETARTYATGFDITPQWNGSPRLSVTYWRIQEANRLETLSSTGAIQNESFFPGRVIRNPRTAVDIAAGQPGSLNTLNLSAINAGSLDTSGIDIQISGSWKTDWGNFSPSFNGTQVTRYQAADFPGSPVVDRLATANNVALGLGSIPRQRATLSLPYSISGYELAPIVRYISSYQDVNLAGALTHTSVSSQTLLDLQATLNCEQAFGAGIWTKGLTLRAGAVNLLNKRPPFAQVGNLLGYDYSEGDIRGRFIYGSIEKKF